MSLFRSFLDRGNTCCDSRIAIKAKAKPPERARRLAPIQTATSRLSIMCSGTKIYGRTWRSQYQSRATKAKPSLPEPSGKKLASWSELCQHLEGASLCVRVSIPFWPTLQRIEQTDFDTNNLSSCVCSWLHASSADQTQSKGLRTIAKPFGRVTSVINRGRWLKNDHNAYFSNSSF